MKHARRIFKKVFPVVAIICTAIFTPWKLLRVWMAPLPATIQEQVDKVSRYGLDGIIVYVDQAGKEPVLYAAGWKNRASRVPADPHALFKIASISKLYIAVAAAKLVNDSVLSLDNTLAGYLPQLNGRIANAEQITLRMMLQHRSGIPNFTDDPDFPWANPFKDDQATLALVLDEPADFVPGSRYQYSNTNYLLIGELIDSVLGYSHRNYIRDSILIPHHLIHTYGLLREVNMEDVTSGYAVGYEPDIKYNDFVNPGGSMVATAQDVGIFLRALNGGTLLNEEEQDIYSSIYTYEHTGLLPGYQSIARYHRDIDAVLIQFVNTSGGNAWTMSEIMYNRMVKILRKGHQ
mgnify:CR=1 FL=1